MEFEQYLYDEFIAEANDHLLTIEEDFLALEANRDDQNPELVDKVFRAIHSVKGGSAFLDLVNINQLAHVIENILDKMREDQIKADPEVMGPMLKGVDELASMVADPTTSNERDIAGILADLRTIAGLQQEEGKRAKAKPGTPDTAKKAQVAEEEVEVPAGPDLPGDTPFELDSMDMEECLGEQDFCYLLRYTVGGPGSKDSPTPKAILDELDSTGEVRRTAITIPEPPSSPEELVVLSQPVRLDVVYATLFDPDMLAAVVGLDESQIFLLAELKADEIFQEEAADEARGGDPDAVEDADIPNAPDGDTVGEAAEVEAAPSEEPAGPVERKTAPAEEPHAPGRDSAPPSEEPGPAEAVKRQETTEGDAPAKPKPARTSHERSGGFVRINVDLLDKLMTLAGELVLVRNQQLITRDADPSTRDIVQRLDHVTTDLQSTIMRTRMQPIGNVTSKLPRMVRDLSQSLGKEVQLEVTGSEVELDKTILESLADPLTHIVRNCCDHGIETPEEREAAGKPRAGLITVHAYHEAGQINMVFSDDGRGVDTNMVRETAISRGLRSKAELDLMSDREINSLILLPGFSTKKWISPVSGRGVGMDVVKHCIEELGGSVELDSSFGRGMSLHLRLPLTLAIIPCLIVTVGEHRFAIPQVNLEELVCLYDEEVFTRIEVAGNQEVYRLRDRLLPMVRLREVLTRPEPFTKETKSDIARRHRSSPLDHVQGRSHELVDFHAIEAGVDDSLYFAVVKIGSERFGLIVDSVQGTEEIVVKPMHPSLKHLKCYSGATVMGDGSVALILDIEGIARHAGVSVDQLSDDFVPKHDSQSLTFNSQSFLLFKNGPNEQFALSLPVIRRIERINMERIETVGGKEFITIDNISTLVVRLEDFLAVTPCREQSEIFLILPKYAPKPYGILISQIVDIHSAVVELNTETYTEDGLLGTDIILGKLTLFPDVFRIIERAEPRWFPKRVSPGSSRNRVLLLEDSHFLRLLVQSYLLSGGYQVTAVENGRDGLQMMSKKEFDLIVSDIDMPIMNGIDFIKKVRYSTSNKTIPAMALTAIRKENMRERALAGGFDSYQIKLDREQFLSEVSRLMEERYGGQPEPASLEAER